MCGTPEKRAGLGVHEVETKWGWDSYMLRDFQVGIQALVLQHCLKRDREGIGVYEKVSPQKKTMGRGGLSGAGSFPKPNAQAPRQDLRSSVKGVIQGTPGQPQEAWLWSLFCHTQAVWPWASLFPLCVPQFPHWFSDR